MVKNLITAVLAAGVMMLVSGCSTMHMGWTAVTGQHKLDDGAMKAYDDMFTEVMKNGDPARAMMNEYEVSEDVSNEDVVESIKALAEEYNMRVTGDTKMFTIPDAKPNEVKYVENLSMCSLYIAKKFLNHSRYFGGFMPCRIMLVEYGNGKRYLITMDLTLAIHGGYPLPPEMLKLATQVKTAMEEIPARAAKGDF
ncbi:DUF302 domain-containing protein [Sulfurimonas sp.]|uniref:DUF302 domain-containing protein n=1 Tax=Sulfurimonas sp. TaxID=2022749 RepID=UPI002635536B|nr:DUF302 domain-containing protein [Sulfurimonas sp.]